VTVELALHRPAADLPPDTSPRAEYDPATRTLTERQQAKATEVGVTARTIESRRARYTAQGLWGLVDQRATRDWEATGRADARLVEVVREVIAEQTNASTRHPVAADPPRGQTGRGNPRTGCGAAARPHRVLHTG
jgi:hypothetical protein